MTKNNISNGVEKQNPALQDKPEISGAYEPKTVEDKIYAIWEKSGFFSPDKLPDCHKKPFTIIMPPANANGSLHLGHAVFVTLQDIMIRYKRMKGFKTLWLPGTDHAGFETQVVFDKKLEKEGRNRFQIPREQIYQEIWDFTQTNKKITEEQLRKLGASCDWSREKFTLDSDIIKTVYETFEQLYKDGLAYRGLRVINWCPKHKTSLSDLEIKYIEREDSLYYIKYQIINNKNGSNYLTVATTRPETMFGDTAVAVNPKDKKYKNLIGKTAIIPLINKKIPIIADNAIDMKFGTGAVKVTPAHDTADFEIWQRHKNEIEGPKIIIDENGRLANVPQEFQGLKTAEARQKVIEMVQKIAALKKIEPNYKHQVSTCYKCGNILEPMPKPQWFIKMKPLAATAIKVIERKKIKFIPDRAKKTYFHWLKNIRDWNISRQIPWGIPVPVWFCQEQKSNLCQNKEGIILSRKQPLKCPYCKSAKTIQDPDVFDTWFSSSEWPFAALGYPNNKDYKNFYPTDVMETGYDILFFWVARMIMLGLYRTKKIPFKNVYLHGLVRDKDRQKMSKSKGNVIDPLGVMELYGTDAVRMALTIGNTPGNDIVISEEKIKGYRNFTNKVWNASRFVTQNGKSEILNPKSETNSKFQSRVLGTNFKQNQKSKNPKLTKKDKQILNNLNKFVKDTTKLMDDFKFYLAAEKIYHYFWHTFADKIIEESKPRLQSKDTGEREAAQFLLMENLTTLLKLLHPFMPFITEEIWSRMPQKNKKLLIIENWPK